MSCVSRRRVSKLVLLSDDVVKGDQQEASLFGENYFPIYGIPYVRLVLGVPQNGGFLVGFPLKPTPTKYLKKDTPI